MFRKLMVSGLAVGLAAVSTGALADHNRDGYGYEEDRYENGRYGDYDYARVVDVEPMRRRVRVSEPVRECWDERRYEPDGPFSKRHAGSTVLGSIIGGVIGNQLPGHDARRVGRAAGAIIGGAVGYSASKNRNGSYDREYYEERCEVRYRESFEERIEGYRVTYEYAGRQYTTRMPYDPGDRIRIRVDVTPTRG